MASPDHRHQSSLENVINFSPRAAAHFTDDNARDHAQTLFFTLLQRLDASHNKRLSTPYRRLEMVRRIHQFSRTQQSKDTFLRSFLSNVEIDIAANLDTLDPPPSPERVEGVIVFTDHLFFNFFLPRPC